MHGASDLSRANLQCGTSVGVEFVGVGVAAEQQSTDVWSVVDDGRVERRQGVAGRQRDARAGVQQQLSQRQTADHHGEVERSSTIKPRRTLNVDVGAVTQQNPRSVHLQYTTPLTSLFTALVEQHHWLK